LHGLPHWAVSIALEHKGQIVAGVVYDPTKDEMFFAEKGAGAWMNESRIRASVRNRIDESLYATGIPFATRGELPATLKDLANLMPACAGVRRFGAASLDLAYVAAGRYDGFWERSLQVWDMAAGIVIAKEAGAIVEGIAPHSNPLDTNDILVANEPQFEKFSKFFRV
jgi:myo-inositol-1(or 4)-monophosphatase